MVRSTKVEKTPVAPVVAAAPVNEVKATKATKTPKAAKAVAAAPVEEPIVPVVAAPAVDPVTPAVEKLDTIISSETRLADLEAKHQQIGVLWTSIKSTIKELRKDISREKKAAEKSSKTKAVKKVNKDRKPSGFTKPTLISDELAKFLGKAAGTEMSRTAAAKEVIAYIKSNKLTDEKNGRIIHPDAALSALLKVTSTDNLHYFNLQTFMKPHFIKTVVAATA